MFSISATPSRARYFDAMDWNSLSRLFLYNSPIHIIKSIVMKVLSAIFESSYGNDGSKTKLEAKLDY
mgnify:CR=1 FL=1|jgi:hypothetical protein